MNSVSITAEDTTTSSLTAPTDVTSDALTTVDFGAATFPDIFEVIPIKWLVPSSADGFIRDTSIVGSAMFETASCNDGLLSDTDISDAESTCKAGLCYYETREQFVFNWNASKPMKGSCRVLKLTLNDGKTYAATFNFK